MTAPAKKATFSLHVDVLEDLDRAVSQGAAPSKNALVEQALRKELDEVKRRQRRADWATARSDPLFMRDIQAAEASFAAADAEAASRIG